MPPVHVQPRREADPVLSITEDKPIKAPAKLWVALLGAVAFTVAAYTKSEIARETDARRIDQLEAEQRDIRMLMREVRDVSIRIEARTEALQRQLDRPNR